MQISGNRLKKQSIYQRRHQQSQLERMSSSERLSMIDGAARCAMTVCVCARAAIMGIYYLLDKSPVQLDDDRQLVVDFHCNWLARTSAVIVAVYITTSVCA